MPFTKFEPLDERDRPCTSPEHDPPSMLVQQPGTYTWKCPHCGREVTYVVPPRPICSIDTVPPICPNFSSIISSIYDIQPFPPGTNAELMTFHHTF
jgi:hypothetical protein